MAKYIDAEAFKAQLSDLRRQVNEIVPGQSVISGTTLSELIDLFPAAADVQEVRHGRWEEHIINNIYCEGGVAIRLTCSVCGECFTVTREARPRERFCRWCGAKMDEVE